MGRISENLISAMAEYLYHVYKATDTLDDDELVVVSPHCLSTSTDNMQAPLKELDKLKKLTSTQSETSLPNSRISLLSASTLSSNKGKQTASVSDTLDGLLAALRDVKERIEAGIASENDMSNISQVVDEKRSEVEDRQKEIHGTLGRIGKALDKVSLNRGVVLCMIHVFHWPEIRQCSS